jgi:hypothetical protein
LGVLARGSGVGRGFVGLYEFWMIHGWLIRVWWDGFLLLFTGFDLFFGVLGAVCSVRNKHLIPFRNALAVNLQLFDILLVYAGWWIRG